MFVKLVLLLAISSSATAMTLDELAASQLKAKQGENAGTSGAASPRVDESLPLRRVVSIMNGRSGWVAMVETHDGKNIILREGEKLDGHWQAISITGKGLVFALGSARRAVKFGEVYQYGAPLGGPLPLPPLPYPSVR